MIILVMGASGTGTTTIGNLIAKSKGFDILESDFFKWESELKVSKLFQNTACYLEI